MTRVTSDEIDALLHEAGVFPLPKGWVSYLGRDAASCAWLIAVQEDLSGDRWGGSARVSDLHVERDRAGVVAGLRRHLADRMHAPEDEKKGA